MQEFFVSLLGGYFAGASVVAVIGKMLIGNSLKKSVKRFEHELSIKKDVLQADLSLFACHQNLVVANFE